MSIALGKYAFTVLAAWGGTLVLLAAIVVQTLLANARARHALDREEDLRARRESHDGRGIARGGVTAGSDDGAGSAARSPAARHPSQGN